MSRREAGPGAGRRPRLLVVAGEASGDRLAAAAVESLARRGVECFGLGGRRAAAAGLRLLGSPDGAMGLLDAASGSPGLLRALVALRRELASGPVRAALLVNASELSAHLGRALRRRGVRVLWCAPPQVWAWRPGRLTSLRGSADRIAVLLPFEEALWRGAGHDAHFVGHPAADLTVLGRIAARARLGLPQAGRVALVLPGSRAGEARRLAAPLCEAARRLVEAGRVERALVLAAPDLPPHETRLLARVGRESGLPVAPAHPDLGAAPFARAFDVALCASGTAALETALAALPTVVAYRLDPLTHALARRLVRVPFVSLPNLLLGAPLQPELLQSAATPARLAAAAAALLDAPSAPHAEAAVRLTRMLRPAPAAPPFGDRLARLLLPWLGAGV